MWIETYDGQFINTDKLASIKSECFGYDNGIFVYSLYGATFIDNINNCDLNKNVIFILRISDTNERKIKHINNNVLRELKEVFYGKVKFICIPELMEKYSKEFDAFEEG